MSETHDEKEVDVYVEHPEIVHYTDWNGLQGIAINQCIWATRYDHLNDSSEVHHLSDLLTNSIRPHIVGFCLERIRKDPELRKFVTKKGGLVAVAEHEAKAIVHAAYQTNFFGNPGSTAFSIPFIASFCSHSKDDDYLKANGLLSQWRAYGGGEAQRFAIVFDTKKLADALSRESVQFKYVFLEFSDVVYNDMNLDFQTKFGKLVRAMSFAYDSLFAEDRGKGINEETFKAFMSAATRLKHRAFHEEREVRIVAAPLTVELQAHIKQQLGFDEAEGKEVKLLRYRERNSVRIPYISLFEEQGIALPITRIIVGPCRQQIAVADKARSLIGNRVPVIESETPFLG